MVTSLPCKVSALPQNATIAQNNSSKPLDFCNNGLLCGHLIFETKMTKHFLGVKHWIRFFKFVKSLNLYIAFSHRYHLYPFYQ